jgi:hypothetical protein
MGEAISSESVAGYSALHNKWSPKFALGRLDKGRGGGKETIFQSPSLSMCPDVTINFEKEGTRRLRAEEDRRKILPGSILLLME